MKLRGKEIIIHRNESFTIDYLVTNYDGSPYLVPDEYVDNGRTCYVVITVASSRYDQSERYIKNWYLPLPVKTVESTEIGELKSTDTVPVLSGNRVYKRDGVYVLVNKYDAVATTNDLMEDYEFRIIHPFPTYVTKNWVEQNYMYSIQLVSGETTRDHLLEEATRLSIQYDEASVTNEELYNKIYNEIINGQSNNMDFLNDVDLNEEFWRVDATKILLEPTKLSVMSDLNGGAK